MALDSKYGTISISTIPDDEPVFVFRAQDVLALSVLAMYRQLLFSTHQLRTQTENYAMDLSMQRTMTAFASWPTKKIPG